MKCTMIKKFGLDNVIFGTPENLDKAENALQNLYDSMPTVYGNSVNTAHVYQDIQRTVHEKTAKLAFVEEIKPKICEHEPMQDVWLDKVYPTNTHFTKCSKCGAKLNLKWSPADE